MPSTAVTPASSVVNPGVPATPLEQAAKSLYVMLGGAKGCGDPSLPATALAFQQAWNAAGQSPQLQTTSQYDTATASALGTALQAIGSTNTAPQACGTLTAPTITITSSPAPNYGPAIVIGASAIAVGLVTWAWLSRSSAKRA